MSDRPNASLTESHEAELARGKLRIATLEREAIEQSGNAATVLRAHLDRYQSLVLALAQIIWTRDPKGQMVGEQPSWAAYTGQSTEEYAGAGWLDAVHADDRASDLVTWERAVIARGPCEYEHRLRRHDGEYRYFSVRAVPVFAADGTIREWAGIHSDITQRKLTEHSLREGERRFRELADAMPQVVWGAHPDGHFDYYNRRWYEFTGRPEGALGDASWADVVHPDDQQDATQRWRSAIATGRAYEIEYRLKHADGTYRWYLTRALAVRNESGAITRWLGTSTDIDERKRTEDQLRASSVSLLQSNRELEDFATVASHDLQEPLRKVHSFVGCLRDEQSAVLSVDGLNYLDRIQNAAARMTTLVSDLLEFSRVSSQAKPFTAVDLNEVLMGVISDLEVRLAETGGRVQMTELPIVASDSFQMRQLLQNLIGNALKFRKKDEPAIVQIGAEIIDATDARGVTCRLSVADNGIGFDEKYLDRIFKIFQRLHGRGDYEGTGDRIGYLPQDRRTTRGHDHRAQSPGGGRDLHRHAAALAEEHGANVKDGGTPVILLLADDDPDDREMTRIAFNKVPFPIQLYTVGDGEELLEFLRHTGKFAPPALSPTPGLILLDLNMPRKDGREALMEIKADRALRRIPVVVMTTSTAETDIFRTYDLGSNSYISKPVTQAGLIEVAVALGRYWFKIVTLPEASSR